MKRLSLLILLSSAIMCGCVQKSEVVSCPCEVVGIQRCYNGSFNITVEEIEKQGGNSVFTFHTKSQTYTIGQIIQ